MVVGKRPYKKLDSPLFAIHDTDIETAKSIIEERYGFTPADEYVRDLIQFVNDMVEELARVQGS